MNIRLRYPGIRTHWERRRWRRASAFTLVEMLVTMVVTLILILALSQAFALVGQTVAEGRAAIEMSGNLRAVMNRLEEDLDGVTVPVRPWADDAAGLGYFEIMEGVGTDMNPLPALPNVVPQRTVPDMYGDIDDILAFTAHAKNMPFRGVQIVSGNAVSLQSTAAEIVYFTRFEDRDGDGIPGRGEVTLHRRVLLVRPDLGTIATSVTRADLWAYHSRNDISAHFDATNNSIVANSLADLTRRENRFAHGSGFPYVIYRAVLLPKGASWSTASATATKCGFDNQDDDLNGTTDDIGELGWFGSNDALVYDVDGIGVGHDVSLSELLAFDVQVFDPEAQVRRLSTGGDALLPEDPGWSDSTATAIARGAFVNLFYASDLYQFGNSNRLSFFSGVPAFRDSNNDGQYSSGERWLGVPFLSTQGTGYCTWSIHYERNGVDDDGDNPAKIDEGTNGFDDDSTNGVDDVGERETSPPYPYPLRGIQVKIRVIEPDTRQIRQMTLVSDFIPE